MEAPLWFLAVGMAEVAFVAAFFVSECVRLLFREQIADTERKLHALPGARYISHFATPMATFTVGLVAGYGINQMSEGGIAGFSGLVTVAVIGVALGRFHLQDATGTLPRPVPRARWRLQLADARRTFDNASSLPAVELDRVRSRLDVIAEVGDRLVQRSSTLTWRNAIRRERRWVVVLVPTAAFLPLAAVARTVAVHGLGTAAAGQLGVLSLMTACVIAAAVARRTRHQRELYALGTELRSEAARLTAQYVRA
jgi:hypothetical protein